jgi:hypothetical protein
VRSRCLAHRSPSQPWRPRADAIRAAARTRASSSNSALSHSNPAP